MQRSHIVAALVVSTATAVLSPQAVYADQLIMNGGFESNGGVNSSTFTNWTVTKEAGSNGNWYAQTGTISPTSGFLVPAPPQGKFAAMTDQPNSGVAAFAGTFVLYQDFTVPASLMTANLSFEYFLGNRNSGYFTDFGTLDFGDPFNQQARVDITTTTADPFSTIPGDVLQNVFQTMPGDPLVTGYNTINANVTAVLQANEGKTLRLRFAEVNNLDNFQFGVDNVSLTTNVVVTGVPEPGNLTLLAGLTMAGAAFLRRRRRTHNTPA